MKIRSLQKNTNQISSAFCGMLMVTVVFFINPILDVVFDKLLEDSVNLYFII